MAAPFFLRPAQKETRPEKNSSLAGCLKLPGDLPLGELELPPGAALAILLAFLHARVAGEEPVGPEVGLGRGVVLHQRPGQAHDDGSALAGRATAAGVDPEVDLAAGVGD